MSYYGSQIQVNVDGNYRGRWGTDLVQQINYYGNGGNDTFQNKTAVRTYGVGGAGDDYIVGGSGNDTLFGSTGDDRLFGNSGNDYLNGGSQNDYLDGGDDNDELDGWAGDDILTGGADIDTVTFSGSPNGVTVDLAAGTASGHGTDQLAQIENIEGSNYADTLLGDGGSNVISGLGGNDTLYGRKGDDRLLGNSGDDYLNGGSQNDYLDGGDDNDELDGWAGDDTVTFSESPNGVTVDLAAGTASGHGTDQLAQIENIEGSSYADTLLGDDGSNAISGLGGNDTLYGRKGDDRLFGNSGDDYLNGGSQNDYLDGGDDNDELDGWFGDDILIGGADIDTVTFSGSPNGVTVDLAAGTASGHGTDQLAQIENIEGSNYADTLLGDDGSNVISGLGGKDTLYGRKGNDRLFGNSGNDYLNGGSQNDYLDGGADNDELDGWFGDDILIGGAGIDTVTFSGSQNGVTVDLAAGTATGHGTDQLAQIENIEGSNYADTLLGDDGSNVIRGLGGNDTIHGGAGADHLFGESGADGLFGGDGIDTLNGGSGADRLLLHHVPGTTGQDVIELNGRTWQERFSESLADVQIDFRDTSAATTNSGMAFVAASFTQAEIELVDQTLALLHLASINLLRRSDGATFDIYRVGPTPGSGNKTLGWNNGSDFYLTADAFAKDVGKTLVHEIAHFWDTASEMNNAGLNSSLWTNFYNISWNESKDSEHSMRAYDGSSNWYDPTTTFFNQFYSPTSSSTDNYGKESPKEDWATSWTAYFFDTTLKNGTRMAQQAGMQSKIDALDRFFSIV